MVELRLDRSVHESVVHIQQDWHFEQERGVEGMSALLDSDIPVVDGMWVLHTAHSPVHTTGHDILAGCCRNFVVGPVNSAAPCFWRAHRGGPGNSFL